VDQDPHRVRDLLIWTLIIKKKPQLVQLGASSSIVGGLNCCGPEKVLLGLELLLLWATTSVIEATTSVIEAKTSVHGMKFCKQHFAY
jgi:hypothetical protein